MSALEILDGVLAGNSIGAGDFAELGKVRAALVALLDAAPPVAEMAWQYLDLCDSDSGCPAELELDAFSNALKAFGK